MKDLSLLLLMNSLRAKVIRNFCNGESATSTLDQRGSCSSFTVERPLFNSPVGGRQPTLEEMILQLEMEEKKARRGGIEHHRMSCVNSSDILRTARNALNQYPRFSLDGKDAMYRSSFTNLAPGKKLVQIGEGERIERLPDVVGGESVIWCKPGVVGKLMGLEAMPVPLNSSYRRERLSAIIKRQNLRKRAERQAMERRRMMVAERNHRLKTGATVGSCSRTGYCTMKPINIIDIDSAKLQPAMRRRSR